MVLSERRFKLFPKGQIVNTFSCVVEVQNQLWKIWIEQAELFSNQLNSQSMLWLVCRPTLSVGSCKIRRNTSSLQEKRIRAQHNLNKATPNPDSINNSTSNVWDSLMISWAPPKSLLWLCPLHTQLVF